MLCLNAIVKNECARVQRMLESAKPYISTFAILDTGSTDGTDDIIKDWAAKNGINGILAHGAFVDFSQARNQALDLARTWWRNPTASVPEFSHLLLMDADMELVVDDPAAFDNLPGLMYEMIQKGGSVSYHNPRLLAVYSNAEYTGVTHEYLNVPPAGLVEGAYFKDHADGSNRKDKFERDIKLLRDDLRRDPDNARSWFYLGNSYRDSNRPDEAIAAYQRRLDIGGWDEEDFITRCNIACCYKDMGDEAEFVSWSLLAYAKRPGRAESLYDLAHYFREKGENQLAMMFAEIGVLIPRPNDKLFVNDFVYSHGFREELSIAGWYTDRREKAFKINNGLALDLTAPEHLRRQARNNAVHYLRPLKEFCPSIAFKQIELTPNPGFVAMNPSVTSKPGGSLEAVVRTVNYQIDEQGRYMIGEKGCGDAPIITENWLITLDEHLGTGVATLVAWDRPAPKFDLVIGLEDMRVFWREGRFFSACVREQSDRGECEQWEGYLDDTGYVWDAKRISDGTQTEKNWAPVDQHYMYRLDELADPEDGTRRKLACSLAVDNISGSSQWVPFVGGHLAVVHEAVYHPGHGKRVYQHRFAFRDVSLQKLTLSLPFVFQDVQIEFCAGLAPHPNGDDLIISFGVRDCEAWFARIAIHDVFTFLGV